MSFYRDMYFVEGIVINIFSPYIDKKSQRSNQETL